MQGTALIIGNSDGIGLATTKELLKRGWNVVGISRSESPINDPAYEHIVAEVQDDEYPVIVKSVLEKGGRVDLCVYCAGIGEMLDLSDMDGEAEIFDVNLLGMVKTVSVVIPLSSEAPSYHASKAGFSYYLEGLALALRSKGVHMTNVRFGFVDTKMAQGDVKPFMMGVERAAQHVLTCIEKKPIRHTAPWAAIPLVKFRRWMLRLSIMF